MSVKKNNDDQQPSTSECAKRKEENENLNVEKSKKPRLRYNFWSKNEVQCNEESTVLKITDLESGRLYVFIFVLFCFNSLQLLKNEANEEFNFFIVIITELKGSIAKLLGKYKNI